MFQASEMKNNKLQKRYSEMPTEIFFKKIIRTLSGIYPSGYVSSFKNRLISFLQKFLSLLIFRREFQKS